MSGEEIVFWVCIGALVYSYAVYPFLLFILSLAKEQNQAVYKKEAELPSVSILIAAYNEELVIADKLNSIVALNYPLDKLEVYVGSDASDDQTDKIVQQYVDRYPFIYLQRFKRSGKPFILRQLANKSKGAVLLLTDANVMLSKNVLFELCKHFKNDKIGIVGANVKNTQVGASGISKPEKNYIQGELLLKYWEGKVFRLFMGAFGACYAIRKEALTQSVSNRIVEDFFITIEAYKKGYEGIMELNAVCYEDVSDQMSEEYRRKMRISIGNFQNLMTYNLQAINIFSRLGFTFFSHKVLRWLGPFFILGAFLTSFMLKTKAPYSYTWNGVLLITTVLFLDQILMRLRVNIRIFRAITHFIFMNIALMMGFFHFLFTKKSTIWKPTKRLQ